MVTVGLLSVKFPNLATAFGLFCVQKAHKNSDGKSYIFCVQAVALLLDIAIL